VQLANIAHRVGRRINVDPDSGRIVKDRIAAKLWKREYEKGWEPKL
jgi:hypothetical protein